jgi:hypothetical protein
LIFTGLLIFALDRLIQVLHFGQNGAMELNGFRIRLTVPQKNINPKDTHPANGYGKNAHPSPPHKQKPPEGGGINFTLLLAYC